MTSTCMPNKIYNIVKKTQKKSDLKNVLTVIKAERGRKYPY